MKMEDLLVFVDVVAPYVFSGEVRYDARIPLLGCR
jgi:hypothetical protein